MANAASSGPDPRQPTETLNDVGPGKQQSSSTRGPTHAQSDTTDSSYLELDRLGEGHAHAKAEHQLTLAGPEASVERVRFDRRKRRPAAIITKPGFYVPKHIESGDPLLNEHKLRDTSPPERVLVGHGRPRVPKLYFENSAPLLGSKESLLPEEAPDPGAEPPRSAPPANSGWGNIPNVLLTPRSLRLTSSDLAERLARRYPATPGSAGSNQQFPRFEDLPDSPTLRATKGRRTKTTNDFSLHLDDSSADDNNGGVETQTKPSLLASATNGAYCPTVAPSYSTALPLRALELDGATSVTRVVESAKELEEGALPRPIEMGFKLRGSYNTCRVGVYDLAIGCGTTTIADDPKDTNSGRTELTVTAPAEVAELGEKTTLNPTPTTERTSKNPPGLPQAVPSSNAAIASTEALCLPVQSVSNEVVPHNDAQDNARLRVYGSMMDSADLGVGSADRSLNVGAVSLRSPLNVRQAQQQGQKQQLPQRPLGVCPPSISQAQQHHPGLFQPLVNHPQGISSLNSALALAYELMRTNSLSSLPAIHHSQFGIPVNHTDPYRPSIPAFPTLTSPTNGQFGVPNNIALLANPLQLFQLKTSLSYPPQVPHNKSNVRDGRYGRGRRPGATNSTTGALPTTNRPDGTTPVKPVNVTNDDSDDGSMTWQEAPHPQSLDVLNLPARSVPGAASLLSELNSPSYTLEPGHCCFVIKSKSEADVRASITHGIWSSTEKGNQRLNEQYHSPERSGPFLLIFCVNGSREVCGMAEMISPVNFEDIPDIWEEKGVYKGSLKVRWVFCKNADYALFSHILLDATRGDLPALHLRDALPFKPKTARSVIKALAQAPVVETILTHPKPARHPRRPRGQNSATSGTAAAGTRLEAPSSVQARHPQQ
ncbi:MAG: hypothetical protein M1839_006530 [Geoglossum umbratile]|nr:MAG: hypothetical protein M1839_006530 [Geoglossum umbratile]